PSARAEAHNRRGYLFFFLGIVILTAEPALILFTVNLWLIGGIAIGLWVGFLILLRESARVWAPSD
ncbi:MAG: hypothetical protein ACREDF_07560, partial [Thermoplasmata archaeon]